MAGLWRHLAITGAGVAVIAAVQVQLGAGGRPGLDIAISAALAWAVDGGGKDDGRNGGNGNAGNPGEAATVEMAAAKVTVADEMPVRTATAVAAGPRIQPKAA